MPQQTKGIRLWLRPARHEHAATWIIRDGNKQLSTGCNGADIEGAQRKLAEYIAKRYEPQSANDSKASPSEVFIGDILIGYARAKESEGIGRPKELAARIERLDAFLGDTKLADLTQVLCKSYAKKRGTPQAARRELEDLRAAINLYFIDVPVRPVVRIAMPDKAAPRERWLTESEAARFLLTAWRRTAPVPNGATRRTGQHVARFTLVGLYTGTRAARICGAALKPTEGRGYIDLEKGVFYRRPPGTVETKKRQPPVRLPERLLAHIRRWARLGLCKDYVVEWNGAPVDRVSKAFRAIAEAAGLEKVTPHTLRHTAISWALQRGAKTYDVAEFFGVSEEVIRETYGHHHPEHQLEVTRRMDRKGPRAEKRETVAETVAVRKTAKSA